MGNKTSCAPIRSVIILVINNRTAAADFFYRSYDYRPNWTSISPKMLDRGGIGFPSVGENKTVRVLCPVRNA